MKFAVALAAFVAVAVASPVLSPSDSGVAEIEAIIAAINSPSTDPATAVLLEQQLASIIAGLNPVVVDNPVLPPISVGPAIVPFPLPDGGALTPGLTPIPDGGALTPVRPTPVSPAPAVVAEPAQSGSPLVQIILNINQNGQQSQAPVAPAPVESPVVVDPVNVVDEAVNVEPSPVAIAPIVIVDPDVAVSVPEPVEVEPIQIGTPVLPVPVVPAPEILN